jgi:hypothetical protein
MKSKQQNISWNNRMPEKMDRSVSNAERRKRSSRAKTKSNDPK